MDYLDTLKTFVAIDDAGSLVGGARQRRLSAPTVTRALASLEERLGARLIVRTTRSLRLTEVGDAFLGDARRVLGALESAEAAVTGRKLRPEGQISLTAPELFGERHVAPIVFAFLEAHPQLRARLLFTNRLVHLVDEGFDVAVRIGTLPDSGLTAVPLGTMRALWVAAPSYLAKRGVPRSLDELSRHHVIALSIEGQHAVGWDRKPRPKAAPLERIVVNQNPVKVAAAVAGLGIARALAYQVDDEVRDGRLRVLMSRHEPPPIPVSLVYPEGRAATAKVRELVRFAAPILRAMPLLQGKAGAKERKK